MLKKMVWLVGLIGIFSFMVVSPSYAQPGMGRGQGAGLGQGMQSGRTFDPKTVETMNGEVATVEKGVQGQRMSYEVRFSLKTDKETIPVILGPSWYVDKQDFKIEPKDTVEVTGSRITVDGQPSIIAAEVKKGAQLLKLRDATGIPVWAGQGRNQ
jgi:hypothetical protein